MACRAGKARDQPLDQPVWNGAAHLPDFRRQASNIRKSHEAIFGPHGERRKLVDHLQRKLNLPRRPRRFADDSKAAAADDIRRQSEIHDVEQIEELRAEFESAQFGVATVPEWSVFDQGEVEVVIAGTAENIAAQRAETAAVGTSPAGEMDWNVKERAVAQRAHPEIVVTRSAAGREMRHRDQVGTISSAEARSRLLHAGEDRERRTGRQRCDVEKLPAPGQRSPEGPQKGHTVEWQ